MTHPPVYYTVRTAVRFLFWTAVFSVALAGFAALVNALEGPPSCDVRINADSTWSADYHVDLDTCQHPDGILLHDDHTWELWDEAIQGPRLR